MGTGDHPWAITNASATKTRAGTPTCGPRSSLSPTRWRRNPDAVARTAAAKAPLPAWRSPPGARTRCWLTSRCAWVSTRREPRPAALAGLYAQAEQEDGKKRVLAPAQTLRFLPCRRAGVQSGRAEDGGHGHAAAPRPRARTSPGSLARAEAHLVELLRDPAAQRDSVYVAADEFLAFCAARCRGTKRKRLCPVGDGVYVRPAQVRGGNRDRQGFHRRRVLDGPMRGRDAPRVGPRT